MRQNGLTASRPRASKATTNSAHQEPVVPNLVARDFSPPSRNHTWAAAITDVRPLSGWHYFAAVFDFYSRRGVVWALADHMRTEFVIASLNMAVTARKPRVELVIHSDRGSQYASR